MSNPPSVSIIVPAYNVAPYITETLESIFAQTYRDFAAIVINDGSTDDTEARITPFLDRIIYLKQKNSGLSAARNAGIRRAQGRYLGLLDGDDVWLPGFLERLVGMLEADQKISAVFPNAYFLGSPQYAGRLYQDVFTVSEPVTFDRVLKRECYIFGSLLFRRSVLDEVGMFDEGLQGLGAEDFDLWLRILQCGHRFKFTTEPLVKYRWRHNSLSNNSAGILRCTISVYEKFLAEERTLPAQRELIESRLLNIRAQLNLAHFKDLMRARNYKEAAPQLEQANKYYQSAKLKLMQAALHVAPGLVRQWAMK
ncbi:MAG: glycosyltransferase family 2 protein [Acidobacteria bacterium]|nr:glycosyltransferase family 2 protein [Acidobacteriota bacterium]